MRGKHPAQHSALRLSGRCDHAAADKGGCRIPKSDRAGRTGGKLSCSETEENLSELEKLNDEVQEIESIHDYKIHWKCNLEFHRKLCSFCGNSYLQKAPEEALRLCTGISNQYYTKSWEGGKEERAGNHRGSAAITQKKTWRPPKRSWQGIWMRSGKSFCKMRHESAVKYGCEKLYIRRGRQKIQLVRLIMNALLSAL